MADLKANASTNQRGRPGHVLVTGAAGKLGRPVVAHLREAGYAVRATDRLYDRDLGDELELADLTDLYQVHRLLAGIDAVVHLGNVPDIRPDFRDCFTANVTANMNVFHAAAERGVGRLVFASSIQAVCRRGSKPFVDAESAPTELPYLPLDSELPAHPTNTYALSKVVSEQMLASIGAWFGMTGFALRLPALVPDDKPLHRPPEDRPISRPWADHGFSYLYHHDAATLIEACLRAGHISGYRCYLPAAEHTLIDMSGQELVERCFRGIEVRRPIDPSRGLVDNSRITAEVGWRPTMRGGVAGQT